MDSSFPVWGIIMAGCFVLLFAGIGGGLIFAAVKSKQKAAASQGWPSVPGVVSRTGVEASVQGVDDDSPPSYSPRVTYRYQVMGVEVENSRIAFGGVASGSRKKAEQFTAGYPVGTPVTVYYNPADPKDAVLERAAKSTGIFMAMGIIFLVISVCSLCVGVAAVAAQFLQ